MKSTDEKINIFVMEQINDNRSYGSKNLDELYKKLEQFSEKQDLDKENMRIELETKNMDLLGKLHDKVDKENVEKEEKVNTMFWELTNQIKGF